MWFPAFWASAEAKETAIRGLACDNRLPLTLSKVSNHGKWLSCPEFILFPQPGGTTNIAASFNSFIKIRQSSPPSHPTPNRTSVFWLKVRFLLIPAVSFHHSMLLKNFPLIWRMHCFCGLTKSQQCWMKINWKSRSTMLNNFCRTKTKPSDSGFGVINSSQKYRQYFL